MTAEHPRAGVDYPRNWHELLAWFPDDGACLRYLERLRWGEHFVCRFCGSIDGGWWQMGDGLRRCASCRAETSVTAGTIFAGTRTPLVSWFAAVWYVVNQKQGVSALGLQRVLGLGSYRTAWSWLHKLRRAMVRPDREAMNGVVEVDETIIGGVKRGHKGRGDPRKTLVAIAAEVRGNGPGRVRMKRIPNASEEVLTDFVLEHVERGAEVHTDAWAGYNGIGRHRFDHVITNVATSPGTPRTSSCPRSTGSSACSSVGCSGPTKAASPTSSSTTTSTSSPSASTAVAQSIAVCSSTACWRARWPPILSPTSR